jgi:4-amino-4-deoxy-L-arabinose transferase-like glycosyltransferase
MARVSSAVATTSASRVRAISHLSPFGRRLAIVALAALAWRLAYVQLELPFNLLTDEAWYVGQAHNLFSAHPWTSLFPPAVPTAQHGPLTSLIVAPFAWMLPHAAAGLRNVMAVVGTGTVVMMGLTARKMGGDRAGIAAAVVTAAFPDFWIRDGLVVSEPVTAFLVVVAVWVALHALDRVTVVRSLALGALAGLVCLARPEVVLAVLVLAVVVIVRSAPGRRVVHIGLVALALVAVISPWVIYNQGRFHDTVILTNNLGTTLVGANCPQTYYGSLVGYDSLRCEFTAGDAAQKESSDESVQSSILRQQAESYVSHHLSRVPLVLVMREAWFLGLYRPGWVVHIGTEGGQPAWATWTQDIAFYIVFAAAMAAWWINRRRRWRHWIIGVLILNSFFIAAIFVGHWRYRITLDVGVVLIVAMAYENWSRRHEAPAEISPPPVSAQ